jgi:hypothetical protein
MNVDRAYAKTIRWPSPPLDRVRVPTEPCITALCEKALCVISVGHNCYILTNVYGDEAEVPFGALFPEWERIAYGLLAKALRETPSAKGPERRGRGSDPSE